METSDLRLTDADIAATIERVTIRERTIETVLTEAPDVEEQSRRIRLPWAPHSFRRRCGLVQPAGTNVPQPGRAMRSRAREVFEGAFCEAHRWLD